MSYSRQYRDRITLPYSGVAHGSTTVRVGDHTETVSVSIPYSGQVSDDIVVDIEVNTTPFDRSVSDCTKHVDALTGSVVATEAAQIASIREKGKQIGDTVINGFFNTVRFEISSQIVELTKRVEALLLDLHEKQKKLMALREQMERDYHRTADRYTRIFTDLDNELENRVHSLDQPVYNAALGVSTAEARFMESDMINVVALAGKENAILDAQIGTALAKQHAQKALSEANLFLTKKMSTESTITHCKLDDNCEQTFYAPVCCALLTDEHNVQNNIAFGSEILPNSVSEEISQRMDTISVPELSSEEKESIDVYFKNYVNEFKPTDEHSARVLGLISKLYSI